MKRYIYLLIAFFAFLFSPVAGATTVYQWTDEEGVVHFSDVPPDSAETEELREIPIASYESSTSDPDKYSIINQVERMETRRRQLAEERLAKKQLQLEEKRLAQQQEAVTRSYESYNSSSYRPYYIYSGPRHSYFSPRSIYYRHGRATSYFSNQQFRHQRAKHFRQGTGNHGHHSGRFSSGLNIGIRF